MKKIILVVVLLIVIAVLSIPLWIDSVARTGVEEGGTMALGVPTKLDSIGISILGGEATMAGLQVDNPEGFDTPHFMKLDDGFVAVSLGTLMADKVVVPEITLTGIDMNLEKKGSKSNYKVILGNLEKGEKAPKDESAKKFVINKIVVKDIRVQTRMELIGGVNPGVKVKIPQIVLTDVGSDSDGGVVMRDVFDQLIKGILKGIVDSGVNLGGDIGKELGKGLKGVAGVTAEVVGEGAKEIGDAIGGLFGGKKK